MELRHLELQGALLEAAAGDLQMGLLAVDVPVAANSSMSIHQCVLHLPCATLDEYATTKLPGVVSSLAAAMLIAYSS